VLPLRNFFDVEFHLLVERVVDGLEFQRLPAWFPAGKLFCLIG
jgi:hypothetical protein